MKNQDVEATLDCGNRAGRVPGAGRAARRCSCDRGGRSPFRPVARAAVGTAAVIGTAAVVGSVVRSIPPSCHTVMVGNVAYHDCGGAWYQPRYAGSQVTYVVVNPPQ